jgi:hypothetical protein
MRSASEKKKNEVSYAFFCRQMCKQCKVELLKKIKK